MTCKPGCTLRLRKWGMTPRLSMYNSTMTHMPWDWREVALRYKALLNNCKISRRPLFVILGLLLRLKKWMYRKSWIRAEYWYFLQVGTSIC
ncbi:hypothetical protein [Sporisorium scitamineum]|uniref:Uncharacterized protein n=1 Tax=Sporisorium scitamineum TaxID=49012 RepID=A0A0F7S4D4_9BASI|nr:hypothetical protein [Sporisorium scitamineum]